MTQHVLLFEQFEDEDYLGDLIKIISKKCRSYKNPLLSLVSGDTSLIDVSLAEMMGYFNTLPNIIQTYTLYLRVTVREKNPKDEVPDLLNPLFQKGKLMKEPHFFVKANDGGIYCTNTWEEIIKAFRRRVGDNVPNIEKWVSGYDVYDGKQPKPRRINTGGSYNHPSELSQALYDYGSKQNIITSDATDVVRLCRILDTEDQPRYEDDDLTVYRSVVGYDNIRPGDWVSVYREYAEDHNMRNLGGKGNIVEMTVNGRDVLQSPTGNPEEAIYAPLELSKPYEYYHLKKRKA